MAHTPPTVDEFVARFPEFEDTEEELIQQALSDAARFVGTNWAESDYAAGIALLAAHFVQTGAGAYDSAGLRSFSIGAISVTYADGKATADLEQSSYGQRFINLRDLNCRGAVVV